MLYAGLKSVRSELLISIAGAFPSELRIYKLKMTYSCKNGLPYQTLSAFDVQTLIKEKEN